MDRELNQDEILFDRLVDGELSDVERQGLLASLDDRPDGWRHCALAFLEAQSWRGDLGNLLQVPLSTSEQIDRKLSPVGRRKLLQQNLAWLAIAASLLVAFTLTLVRRNDSNRITNNPPVAENLPTESFASTSPDSMSLDDALTLWVRDDRGQTRPLRVPLVDAGALDRELGVTFQSAMPQSTRQRLQERGFDVQSKRRYAPLWLENGRPMIVPVEDTKIVPVSQNVY